MQNISNNFYIPKFWLSLVTYYSFNAKQKRFNKLITNRNIIMKNSNTFKLAALSTALMATLFFSQAAVAYENHEEGEAITTTDHPHSMKSGAFEEYSFGNGKKVGGKNTEHLHRNNYLLDLDENTNLFPDPEQ
jgi:hypothetical protein